MKAGLQKGQQLSEQKPHRKWLGAASSQSSSGQPAASLEPTERRKPHLSMGRGVSGWGCCFEFHMSEGGRGKVSVSVCSGEGSQNSGAGGGLAATSLVGSGWPALSLPSLPPLFPSPGSLLSHPSLGAARAMGAIR